MRRPVAAVLACGVMLLALPLTASTSGAATSGPTCFGRAATIVGTAGDDAIWGTNGSDVIVGLGGNDHLIGDERTIYFEGLGGDDFICGGDGADTVMGGEGDDRVSGGPGRDFVMGDGEDADYTQAVGNDVVKGDAGPDQVFGGYGNDVVNGGPGDDHVVDIHGGTDRLLGETGNDRLYSRDFPGDQVDIINGGRDTDACETGAADRVTSCEATIP